MTFADLGAGDAIFLDANIFIFQFGPHPIFGPACNALLRQIENGQLLGFTSTHVIGEVAHRLMLTEATAATGWVQSKVKHRLKQQPNIIGTLTRFRMAIEGILQSKIQVLTIPAALLGNAAVLSQKYGQLTNDALTSALMQAHGLNKIASDDADFDRVPGVTRYAPL
jgi:predicted nucleic acid-binding protein